MTSRTPADFCFRYEWHEGSMPPPYHYEYSITVGPGPEGEIVFSPDYPQHDPPVWREAFAVGEVALSGLYALMVKKGVFTRTWREPERRAIGGSQAWLDVTADERQIHVPGSLRPRDAAAMDAVYTAVRALVPGDLWATLRARHEAYQQEMEKRS